jgi:hypothetical protein
MTARKVPLMIPEDVWGHLATLAARRHTDIPSLINQVVADWVKSQRVDLRAERRRDRAQRTPNIEPGSPLDVLAEELYEARTARKGNAA